MKNIVICCDGTGNEISENISNVLKLYRCLRKTDKTEPHQAVFYDPGVGTLARPEPVAQAAAGLRRHPGARHRLRPRRQRARGLHASWSHNYEEGDQIFLFGFSRGAYTVRVLAGLIHKVGLIVAASRSISQASGLTAYKQFSSRGQRRPSARPEAADRDGDDEGPMPASTRRPGGAVRADPLDALADRSLRRRLGYGRQRDRAAAGPAVLAEPGGAGVHAAESERADLPPGDLDRRAALHVPPEEVGRPADLHARTASTRLTPSRRTSSRCGSPACIPISAAAIRKRKSALSKYPADLDDRRGGQARARRQSAHRQPAGLGRTSEKAARSPTSRPISRGELHNSMTRSLVAFSNSCRRATTTRNGRSGRAHFGFYIPNAEPPLHSRGRADP